MLFRAGLLRRWDILLTRPNANMDGGGRNEWNVIRFFIWSLSIAVGTTWGMLGQMTFMQWKLGRVAGGWHDVGLSEFSLSSEVLCMHLPDAFCALPHTERLCSGATGCSERWWQAREHRLALKQVWSRIKGLLPGPSATHAFFGWPLCWAWPAVWFTWPQARFNFASNFV